MQHNLKNNIEYNYSLKNLTRLKVGGCCDIFYKPYDLEDLANFLTALPKDIEINIIGAGSNLLIRDGNVDGAVIKLPKFFHKLEYHQDYIIAGAATLNYSLVQFALLHNIQNLEFLSGIPGSIGGGISMNAGAYGWEFKDILVNFTVIDRNGKVFIINSNDIIFKYRSCNLSKDLIILEAKFKATKGDFDVIKNKIVTITSERERTQPYRDKTAGSTFMNPDGYKAWQLIESVGLRDFRINDATFSSKHCNFLINLGNATAKDLEDLGNLAQVRVLEKHGINLIWEVKKIGKYDEYCG
jgi:UDP-N-acetylmuramate dehydrogenase